MTPASRRLTAAFAIRLLAGLHLLLGGCERRAPSTSNTPVPSSAVAKPPDATPPRPADREWLARHWTQCLAGVSWDPFSPALRSSPAPGPGPTSSVAPPSLSAVWRQAGIRMAVINGAVVSEGSQVPPFRVASIERQRAVLSGPTGLLTLTLAAPDPGAARESLPPKGAPAEDRRRPSINQTVPPR